MQYLHSKPNFIKQFFTSILIVGILLSGLPGAAQTKRSAAKTTQAKSSATEKNQTAFSPPAASAMSKMWQSGVMPQPLALPAGNTDEVAKILAQKVVARNEESVPALMTALQLSGFFITDKNGQVAFAPPDGKGQGLPINGWELASVARMYGDRRSVNLAQLDGQLNSVPILRKFAANGEGIGAVLMKGIREQAGNERNPYLRVWARFIVELGKNSETKYDLTSGARVEQINLDAIQHLLIMRRLYGDFWATGNKYKTVQNSNSAIQNQNEVQFVNASFNQQNNQSFNEFLQSDDKKPRRICEMTGDAPTIFDAVATSLGMGWDKALDTASESSDADIKNYGSKYAAFMTVANILLVYAKFIQTYAALETTITAEDGDAPLIRTKNRVPGARKKLRAKVRMNIGDWEKFNCLRASMNIMTGLDFSTMNDGPLSGVGVQWGLSQGGYGDYYSNAGGVNESGEQIVGLTVENPKRIQDKGVGTGNFTFNKTDDKGETEIILEGTPQKNEKNSMRVTQVRKQARVTTAIEIKAGDIKGDAVDVYGQWADGLPGVLTLPAELLYRTSWAASGALDVPVIDWEECTGAWTGTVSFVKSITRDVNKVEPRGISEGETRTTMNANWTYRADIQVTGETARATIDFNDTVNETRHATEKNSCDRGKTWREMSCTFERKSERSGTGSANAAVRIVVNRQKGTFSISGGTQPIKGKTGGKETGSCSGQCIPKIVKPDIYEPSIVEIEGQGFTIPEQQFDPNSDTISGTYTSPAQYGMTLVVTWNLQRCGTQANLIEPQSESKSETYAGLIVPSDKEFIESFSIFNRADTVSLLFPH